MPHPGTTWRRVPNLYRPFGTADMPREATSMFQPLVKVVLGTKALLVISEPQVGLFGVVA